MNPNQRQRQGYDLSGWIVVLIIVAVIVYGLIEKGIL